MKGKCNCGKPATGEYLVRNKSKGKTVAWTIKLCNDCKPKRKNVHIVEI